MISSDEPIQMMIVVSIAFGKRPHVEYFASRSGLRPGSLISMAISATSKGVHLRSVIDFVLARL